MKEYFSTDQSEKKEIIEQIRQLLFEQKEVMFAFVFGSFLDSLSFRDIDVGIYVDGIAESQFFDLELRISEVISDRCKMPFDIIDVKVLNTAPSYFLNSIFKRGKLLFSRDQQLLTDMIENSSLESIANENIASQSLKELIPS